MAETQSFNYIVAMSCGGCSSAVTRVLNKAQKDFDEGALESFDIAQEEQHVTVVAKPELEAQIFTRLGKAKKTNRADKDWNKIPNEDEKKEE